MAYGLIVQNQILKNGIKPDFPLHHKFQIEFSKKHIERGGKVTAVSDFISYQLKEQWGFNSVIINNGVDIRCWKPTKEKIKRDKPLIIHGVTNANKGYEHIEAIKINLDVEILLLDDASEKFKLTKQETLAQADLVVHPSNFEGNSMFCLETLACDVPIVAYNVGLMWKAYNDPMANIGIIEDRNNRSPETTVGMVENALNKYHQFTPREWVKNYSIDNFIKNWQDYLKREFNYSEKT